jgi:hypothetical protein
MVRLIHAFKTIEKLLKCYNSFVLVLKNFDMTRDAFSVNRPFKPTMSIIISIIIWKYPIFFLQYE